MFLLRLTKSCKLVELIVIYKNRSKTFTYTTVKRSDIVHNGKVMMKMMNLLRWLS